VQRCVYHGLSQNEVRVYTSVCHDPVCDKTAKHVVRHHK